MKQIIVALFFAVAMAFTFPSFATETAETASHAAAVAAASKANTAAPSVTQNEYVSIAHGISDALTATAQKLNVELQDLASSRLGFFVMVIIIGKMAGAEINQWASALTFLFLMGGVWMYWSRKTFGVFNEKGKFVKYEWSTTTGDVPGGALIAFITALIIIITFAAKMP